jgi:sarcosine oxidase, subunit gamma
MRTSTRTEGGCVFDVIARSPIAPPPPVVRADGWEVSGQRATGELTVTDCSPLTKVQLRAPIGGQAAAVLGVPFGRAARDGAGRLVVGSGPGEWLLLAAPASPGSPGDAAGQTAELDALDAPGETVSWVDQTHGRALIRLSGPAAPRVLAKLCGIDLSDDITPDGAAFRTSIAGLATDVIRDDLPGLPGQPGPTRSYLMHCERSSGQYFFDAVLRAGAEFGLEIDGFRMPDALPDPPTSTS